MADPARVFELFRDGATIVFQGLHRYHEPVTRFCRELEVELGHPCQVNAYVTPAGAQGLELHDDPHDVFVLQAFGRKSWEIHAAPGEDEREPIRAEIGPGDCIYMPTGTPHAASTQRSLSGHLTVGVHIVAWRELVRAALDRIAADPSLDDPLPAGWPADLEGLERSLRARLLGARRRARRARRARDRRLAARTLPVDAAAADPWRARRPGVARPDLGRVAARSPGRLDLRDPGPR